MGKGGGIVLTRTRGAEAGSVLVMVELLEREHDLGAIRDGVARACAGDGSCLVVEGPAGIGKSELLAAARTHAATKGCRVLTGSGGILESDFPYGVVRQLFAPAVRAADEGELFRGSAALARPVLEIEGGPRPGVGTSGGSKALEALHGLFWLTTNLTSAAPMLLCVDDAHWCDGASLRFLLYLRRRLEELPVLLLVAARPGEPGSEEHLVDLVGAGERARVIRPGALSQGAVAALLRASLDHEPDPEFTAAAYAATAGNPFLIRELITTLVARQISPTLDEAARVSSIGPEGVQRAVVRRLADLGAGAADLAHAVAVLGGSVELRHAAALAGLDTDVAAGLAESLVRVEILRDERALTFAHPLVRAAIYADIPAAARAVAHARASEVLAAAGASDDAVAAHLLESDPAGDASVIEHLRAAARAAGAQGAIDVAVTYLRRALAERAAPDLHAAVLAELGAAELSAGQPDAAAERLAAAAAEENDGKARLGVVLMRRHALVLADRIEEALAVVDTERERSASELLPAAALGAGHLDFAVVRGIEARLEELRTKALDPAVREPLTLAVAASASAFANERVADVVALTQRAVAALPNAHPAIDYTLEGQLAIALYVSEQFELLAQLSGGWLDDARRRGSLPRFICLSTMRSIGSYRRGALADAEADARDALEVARLYGHHFWLPGAVASLVNPLVEEGRYDEAEAILVDTRVQERHGQSHAFCWTTLLLPARGRLRIAQGRPREGLADLLGCGEHESAANRSPALWPWRSEAALALATLGAQERAAELAREELTLARAFGAPRALGVGLRALGLVTGSEELLREAVLTLERSDASLEHARVLVDLGSAVRRAGRRTDARRPLREGLELAVRCGAHVLARRARDELQAAGAHPRTEWLSGPAALTPSERRVARMAADGLGNPDIAQALFLTRRTVETHLTHVYRKLGIVSREQLAAALGPESSW